MKKAYLKTAGVAALSATVLLTGCGKMNPDATLVTINPGDGTTDTITLGYGNFCARYLQSSYDQYFLSYYGEQMWESDMSGTGSTMQEDTKSGVLEDLEGQYVAKLHASEYGVELSEDQNTAIAAAAAEFMADNPEDTIEALGATEEYVKKYLEDKTIYNLVSEAAKEKAAEDITEDQYWMRSFSYVLFESAGTDEDGVTVEYTGDELEAIKNQAEMLASSDDFDTEAEALGVTVSTYSYLKGETEDDSIDMAVIEAAEAMSEGDVSDVIEVEGTGYFVIKLTSDHDEEASESKLTTLKNEAFTTLLDTWKESIVWTVDEDQWAKVKFDSLFQTKAEEEATEETTEETTEESTEDTTETTTEEIEETDAE